MSHWTETPAGSGLYVWTDSHGYTWTYSVGPPAQGDWYDVDTVVADVLARLRLSASDVDEPRIRGLVPVAASLINNELDRVYPMTAASGIDVDDLDEDLDVTEPLLTNVTPDILEALSRLTIELFSRGKTDNQGNVIVRGNFVGETGGAIDVVIEDISPHKSRFGIA